MCAWIFTRTKFLNFKECNWGIILCCTHKKISKHFLILYKKGSKSNYVHDNEFLCRIYGLSGASGNLEHQGFKNIIYNVDTAACGATSNRLI